MTPLRHALPPAIAAACLLMAHGLVAAQRSPYYFGGAETITRETNFALLGKNQSLRDNQSSRSDTIIGTALLAGVDQPIGRQKVTGSLLLRDNRYLSNRFFNHLSAEGNAGLDWSTIERISGTLDYSYARSLRKFDSANGVPLTAERNIATDQSLRATVRVGGVTRLTAEGLLRLGSNQYSASAFEKDNTRGTTLGGTVYYRPEGVTTFGATLRQTNQVFPNGDGDYTRRDVDFTVQWVPTGQTTVQGRLSRTNVDYDNASFTDYPTTTWELRATTQASGKVKVTANLWRDTGLAYSAFETATIFGTFREAVDLNKSSTNLKFSADYSVTAKTQLTAGLQHTRRDLSQRMNPLTQANLTGREGSDTTTTLSLGWRWAPLRVLQIGCDLGNEERSASGNASLPYTNRRLGCNAQFVLQ